MYLYLVVPTLMGCSHCQSNLLLVPTPPKTNQKGMPYSFFSHVHTSLPSTNYTCTCTVYYAANIHLRLIKGFKTHEPNMTWRSNLHYFNQLLSPSRRRPHKLIVANPGCNQLIDCSPYIRYTVYTNCKNYLLYYHKRRNFSSATNFRGQASP